MSKFSAMTDMARDQEDVKEDLQPMTGKLVYHCLFHM
jgi:hypothetical protein